MKLLFYCWASIVSICAACYSAFAVVVDYARNVFTDLWAVAFPATEAIERVPGLRSTETVVHLRGLSRTRAFRDRLLTRTEPSAGRGSGAGVGTLAFAA